MRTTLPVATLAGAVLTIAAVAVGGLLVNGPGPNDDAAASPWTTASPSAPAVIVTPEPTVGSCQPDHVAARIASWEGAAGQRIATIELVNEGPLACLLEARNHPQLVSGDGAVLIDGKDPATTTVLTLSPGAKATTLVSAGNYCPRQTQPDFVPPVRVAFIQGDRSLIVAEEASPRDATLPPCNGPGQPGEIDMHPWQPAP